jgi:hypothetical protein
LNCTPLALLQLIIYKNIIYDHTHLGALNTDRVSAARRKLDPASPHALIIIIIIVVVVV